MMEIFLDYNFNNIKYILFDEPENFLDEEYLKIIGKLVRLLISEEYNIRIASHSPGLLFIMQAEISNVLFFHNQKSFQINHEDVKNTFVEMSEVIEVCRKRLNLNPDASIKFKTNLVDYPNVYNHYIESNLRDIEFYRSLFYSQIIIIEGISDYEALKSIHDSFEYSIKIYIANGKAFIPFYAKLFQMIKKQVTVIIDTDEGNKKKHVTAITKVLDQMEGIKCIKHEPDMEMHYGIDLDEYKKENNISNSVKKGNNGWMKQVAAYCFFNDPGNRQKLQKHLFDSDEEDKYGFK